MLRVAIVQRVLPEYRQPFFDSLAESPGIDLTVFAGQSQNGEAIRTVGALSKAGFQTLRNRYLPIPGGFLCLQTNAPAAVMQTNPDVVVVEANPRILTMAGLAARAKGQGSSVLGWGLGTQGHSTAWPLAQIRSVMYRRLLTKTDGFIAYGTKGGDDYRKQASIAGTVTIAHNAVDTTEVEYWIDSLGNDRGWVSDWRRSVGLDPVLPMVLSVGRLTEPKRVDLLVAACSSIHHRCQLAIVGEGPAQTNLQQQASRSKATTIFLGHQTGEALARIFLAADLFVLPGTGGLALHQAMSYGLPVVASSGDGTERDLVRPGNGLLIEAGDAPGLSQAIGELLEQPGRLLEMGRASRSIIKAEMSLGAMVEAFRGAIFQPAGRVGTVAST